MRFCQLLTVLLLLILPTAGFARENISLRVGVFPFEPFNFVDSQGDAQGLYPDLIRKVADMEGWELTFVSGTWSQCMERLRSGQIDVLTSVALTAERTQIFDFNSIPIVDIWGQVFLVPGSRVSNFKDLHDQKVAVVAGDINGKNFIRVSAELGVVSQIVEYPTHSEVFRAVANHEAIAAISAQHYGIKHAADFDLVTSSLKFSPMSLYFAAQKNRSLPVLAQIDTHLSVWKADKDSFYYDRLTHWLDSKVSVRYIFHWWLVGCLFLAIASVVLLTYLNKLLRKQAVTRSVENEARYRSLIEQFGDAVFVSDRSGRFIDVNDKACKILGYTREELLVLHVTDVDTENREIDQLQALYAGFPLNEQVLVQSICQRKDGTAFPVELNISRLYYQDNEIVFATLRDVSQREKREAVLAAKVRLIQFAHNHSGKEVLQAFIDEAELLTTSSIGFFHAVSEEQKTTSTQAWSSNTLNDMCKLTSSEQHSPIEDAGVWADCLRLRRPVIHNDYMSLLNKSGLPGGHAPVARELVVPVFDGDHIVAVLGVGNKKTDYTDYDVEIVQDLAKSAWELIARKRVEEVLAEKDRIYRRTHFSVEHSHSAMVWLDLAGNIIDFNHKFCFYTGSAREELLGLNTTDINSEWTKERWEDEVLPVLSYGRSPARFESEMIRKNKTQMPIDIELSRFSFEGDELVLAVITDITRRKKAERVQVQLEDELRQSQKMEAIGTLAGGIAHDFNNILTSMIGCTEMAMKRCGDDERLSKYLGVVRDGERRAAELVSQILTFTRQDKSLDMKPLQLSEILTEVINLLRASLPSSVVLDLSVDERCRMVLANSSQLHQVIMNLITNAYQSLPESKGRLDITLKEETVESSEAIRSLKMKPGEYIVLTVQDDGCGIAPQQLERIFDPYFTTRHVTDGTGFGLTIVQQIIQSHKGIILVESTQGEGSLFKVYLPLLHDVVIAAPVKEKIMRLSGRERVLLVDDEEGIRFTLKAGLEELGYQVEIARNTDQTLSLMKDLSQTFDVVVSDMTMPEMSGIDLAKRVQQANEFIPVVLMSGHIRSGFNQEDLPRNVREVLQKPIDSEGLATALRRAIEKDENERADVFVN